MINIKKEGSKEHNKKVCPYCDCEFSYDESDIIQETDYNTLTYPQRFLNLIKCPWCNYFILDNVSYRDNSYKGVIIDRRIY